jgi:hypothetical protein
MRRLDVSSHPSSSQHTDNNIVEEVLHLKNPVLATSIRNHGLTIVNW